LQGGALEIKYYVYILAQFITV